MAAAPKETKALGINDLRISKMLTDVTTDPTYDTNVDIPGITELQVSPTFIEKELRGDEMIIDTYSKLEKIDWSFAHGKISLDALAILIGGAVVQGGVTPNTTTTYSLTGDDLPQYFKMEGQVVYSDAGDIHVILYKCKASKVEYTLTGEEYAKVSVSGTAIPTISNKKVKDFVINETKTAIV